MDKIKCEGNCDLTHGAHNGNIINVVVYGNGWKATEFKYCENAIKEDKKRGFNVEAK